MPYQFEGKLRVYPLNQIEMSDFTEWNNRLATITSEFDNNSYYLSLKDYPSVYPPHTSRIVFESPPQVKSHVLYKEFKERFERLMDVRLTIRANSEMIFGHIEDPKVLMDRELKLSKSFKIKELEDQVSEIVFTISNPSIGRKIIGDALRNLITTARQDNIDLITINLATANQARKEALTAIDSQLTALNFEYEMNERRALQILREQADVARQLGYAKPIYAEKLKLMDIYNRHLQMTEMFFSTLYEHGYLALEEQIRKIESREETKKIPMLGSFGFLSIQKQLLEADDSVEKLTAAATRLPYHNPSFTMVKYDLTELTFKKKGSEMLTIVVCAFLGIIVGCIAALTKDTIMKRRNGIASQG